VGLKPSKKHHYLYNMNFKPIKLPNVEFEMLIELAKKDRKPPEQFIANLINKIYNGRK
jgi:hypothetical protein